MALVPRISASGSVSSRWLAALLSGSLLLAPAALARAQSADEATRDKARQLAQEALDLFDGGKFAQALDRFNAADALVHVPTMQLMAARSLVKLGRLVEALERYDTASRATVDDGASDALRTAVADATRERDALAPRLAAVVLSLDLTPGSTVKAEVTFDGRPVPLELLGQKRSVDPGSHTIEAVQGTVRKSSTIVLKEGESVPLRLDLRADPPRVEPPRVEGPRAGPGPQSSPLRAVGFVTAGAGLVGLAAGAVVGGLAIAKKGELDSGEKGCPEGHCGPMRVNEVGAYNDLRTLSGAALVAGGVALAGGAALILFAPKARSPKTSLRLAPWIGAGSFGLRGDF
jgi:hypothetical protein